MFISDCLHYRDMFYFDITLEKLPTATIACLVPAQNLETAQNFNIKGMPSILKLKQTF